jgi:hypothetical protein
MLDHVIALNERHLRRLIGDYIHYHHEDRIHDSPGKDTFYAARRHAYRWWSPPRRGGEIKLAFGGPRLSRRTADLGYHRGRTP